MTGTGSCPVPEAVRSELAGLVARDARPIDVSSSETASPAVQVIDLGASHRVVAPGGSRDYSDPARDCAQRARVAALFIALTLQPVVFGDQRPAVQPPPPPAPSASESRAPPPKIDVVEGAANGSAWAAGQRTSQLEAAGTVHVGLGAGSRPAEPGVALRLVLGRGVWALVLGIAASLPVDVMVEEVRLRRWRLPLDVGMRWHPPAQVSSFAPYVGAGAAISMITARALELTVSSTDRSTQLGMWVSGGVRYVGWRGLTPFAGFQVEFVPFPPGIHVLPRGVVGHTPALWIGAAAGTAIDF